MTSSYPGALDDFTPKVDNVDDVMAVDINELQEAIEAVETELGTDPAGSVADVKTRLAVALNNDGTLKLVKATGAELDTGTDDAKFATAKAIKDAHNVPSVAPGTAGNVLTSNATDWISAAPEFVKDLSPQLGGDLDLNDHNIAIKTPTSDDTAMGIIQTMTVDTNAEGIGAPLAMAADGHLDTADADSVDSMPCIALALETGTGSKKVLLFGVMRNDDWNWTMGAGAANLIYVSTTVGTLTQTKPTGEDDVVQPIGWALSADVIFFCPSMLWITHTA